MKIFKTRYFDRWSKQEKIPDSTIIKAVDELCQGLHDGNLGGGIYKKRISKKGFGKRSSFRMIIAAKINHKAVFIYGYTKKQKDNISNKELMAYKKYAKTFFDCDDMSALTEIIE